MLKHKSLEQKIASLSSAYPKSLLLIDPGKTGGTIYGSSTNLGLFVLAESAKRIGWQTRVVNLGANAINAATLLAEHNPSIVGITSTSPGHAAAIELARTIELLDPRIILLKGGPHESYSATRLQGKDEYPIDISFIGEADVSLSLVLEAINIRASLEAFRSINGICFRDHGDVITTSARPVRLSPEEFVLPSTAELEEPFNLIGVGSMIRVQSMRGCGFGCEFCAITGKGRRVDPKTFVDYLKKLVKSTGAKSIFFEDATFTLGEHENFDHVRSWVRDFCRLFKEALPGIVFGIQTRADCLNKEINALLFEAGCRSIYIGVETLSNSPLQTLNTKKKAQQQIDAIQDAKKQGLKVTASLICDIGSHDDFLYTVETLRDLEVDEIFMEAEKIFPGTGLAKGKEEEILSFYDKGEISMSLKQSPQVEDTLSFLVSDIYLGYVRYFSAQTILSLSGNYEMPAVGHWIRK